MDEKEIRLVRRGDKLYPERLLEIPDPPEMLYILGRLPEEQIPTVAVIGARDCTEYGKYVARMIGKALGENGIQVISGMARGIDGIGQEAALDAGGSSFAVLGSGVDVCYPAGNRRLYDRLKVQGGILSEYAPGTPALSYHFPARNRIVSGLSDAVIVVEAREKSGTLITVDMALEQGKEVYAVPGRVTDGLSAGCNRLLKLGAGVFRDVGEFMEELRGICEKRNRRLPETDFPKSTKCELGSIEMQPEQEKLLRENPQLAKIYAILDFTPKSVGDIGEQLEEKISDRETISYLMRLSMEKLAVQVSPGRFLRG